MCYSFGTILFNSRETICIVKDITEIVGSQQVIGSDERMLAPQNVLMVLALEETGSVLRTTTVHHGERSFNHILALSCSSLHLELVELSDDPHEFVLKGMEVRFLPQNGIGIGILQPVLKVF